MNRAQATVALQQGKKVERLFLGSDHQTLRWDNEHGIQVAGPTGGWTNETGDNTFTYREVWQPRIFLDVWEEVKTFEEADKASNDGSMRFFCVPGNYSGPGDYMDCLGEDEEDVRGYGGGWVKRMVGK